MQLIAPDLLTDGQGLSPPLCIAGLAVGVALWLLGWWGHRFWVVVLTTVLGGVYGLSEGPLLRAQPLVASLLLAVAAGLLALALVRLAAFAAGGVALLAGVQAMTPVGDQGLILFLIGGIIGVVLFRLWVMALTSLGGTLLAAYSALWLTESLGKIDAAAWADRHVTLLNWLCGAAAFVGLAAQFLTHRFVAARAKQKRYRRGEYPLLQALPEDEDDRRSRRTWGRVFRKAG
jgi:MFS family permease